MPSKSKKQQKFFGIVKSYMEGKTKNPSKNVKEVAESMSKKEVDLFAGTKHKGLPDKLKKRKKKKTTKKKADLMLIEKFVSVAQSLDNNGFTKEADLADNIIVKLFKKF